MLIRMFRSGYVVKIFMFLVISILLWIPAFITPSPPSTISTYGIAYDLLISTFNITGLVSVIIAFLLLLGQAVIFNAVLVENPFFSRSVFLPALIYVILMSYHPSFLTLHPALIANYFLIFSLKNLYNTYARKEAFRESFNASFWVAVASLFYFPAIFMMILVWSAFLIFRINSWREWLISFIGSGSPYLLLIMGFYLFDGMDYFSAYYPDSFSWLRVNLTLTTYDYIFWPVFLVLLLISFSKFSLGRTDKIISIRKGFAVVNAYLFISGLSVFISGPNPHLHAFLIFPPASVVIAFYFIEIRRMLVAELLFLLLLISIAVMKFI